MTIPAFLTGSHVYGKPRPSSDVDLALLVDKQTFGLLLLNSDVGEGSNSEVGDQPGTEKDALAVRFGKLNLLLTTNPKTFQAWENATQDLTDIASRNGPVDREFACNTFIKYEKEVK
jgi:predicted nucleotidyltransferase